MVFEVIVEVVGVWFEYCEWFNVGLFLVGIGVVGGEWYLDVMVVGFGCLFDVYIVG